MKRKLIVNNVIFDSHLYYILDILYHKNII